VVVRDSVRRCGGWGMGGRGGGGCAGGGAAQEMAVTEAGGPRFFVSAPPASAPAAKSARTRGDAGLKEEDKARNAAPAEAAVPLRSNFAETAFWKPQLLTGADGSASIEFTVPDSVTSWNVFVHAVTKDIKAGSI